MEEKNNFKYNYVAPTSKERREIESIRNGYLPASKNEDKLTKLKEMDKRVKNIPFIVALVIGTIGVLIFGLGFAMVLEWGLLVFGVLVGVLGGIVMLLNLSIYKKISCFMKNKYADKIIKLSDELLNDED